MRLFGLLSQYSSFPSCLKGSRQLRVCYSSQIIIFNLRKVTDECTTIAYCTSVCLINADAYQALFDFISFNFFFCFDRWQLCNSKTKKVLGFTSTLIVLSVAMNANLTKEGNFRVLKLIMLPSHVLISVNVELCVACGLSNRFQWTSTKNFHWNWIECLMRSIFDYDLAD